MNIDFDVVSEVRGNSLLLKTNGYINNTGGEMIVKEFTKHPIAGFNSVVIDLENSKVINSIGISYLIEIIETVNQNSYKLFFSNLDPTIEKTFKIMGLFQFAEKLNPTDTAVPANI
ncbi:MAG: anti-sigma factor antagonist [Ignavibacteriales bacterium]|nr:MAG: anti-sigma factor antagonist [Ignavibacteriales bacterium]